MSTFKASSPGSLMLLGEHAVLRNYPALVCAIDQRMSVQLIPREDSEIHIHSALGHHQTTIQSIEVISPFQFVLSALQQFKLKKGCDISIESEFSDQIGFASSAAVTVATIAVLSAWLENRFSSLELIEIARRVVRSVQGVGSGADVAACVLGGVVAYQAEPMVAKKLNSLPSITVLYSGSKMKTTEVLARVQKNFSCLPGLFENILQAIGKCSEKGVDAVIQNDWQTLGHIMNIQQGLMEALLVSTPRLNGLIEELRASPEIVGAKISGSGLGDSVIGLGNAKILSKYPEAQQLFVNVTSEGVRFEKI